MKEILSEDETSKEEDGGTVWKAVFEGVHWESSKLYGCCDEESNDGRKSFL